MVRVIEAVYENGVLKPLADPGLPEGQRVVIEVRALAEQSPESSLQEWQRVYAGLSEKDIADIEETLVRSRSPKCTPGKRVMSTKEGNERG